MRTRNIPWPSTKALQPWEKPHTSDEWKQRKEDQRLAKLARTLPEPTPKCTHPGRGPWGDCSVCDNPHDDHICDYDGTTDDCNVTEDKGDEK